MAVKAKPEIATRDELLILLTSQARKGHVGAMRLLLQEIRLDGIDADQATDFIDELATKREATLSA